LSNTMSISQTNMNTSTPAAQKPQQSRSQSPLQFIRELFAERPRNEFDLCYYETRKVALCAHLLKTN
jgi:hypothetical protein